jgi:hypothetical protein
MKIACIMATEDRAPIWGIGLASFLTQLHPDRHLLVVLPSEEEKAYQVAATGFERHPYMDRVHYLCVNDSECFSVQERLDAGFKAAFDFSADAAAIWDDDDWSPPSRLSDHAMGPWVNGPCYGSYPGGWFVNLRTLRGEYINVAREGYLWGGCLMLNQKAWDLGGGFGNKRMPGYDRDIIEVIKDVGGAHRHDIHIDDRADAPVAFSHHKNVATWLKTPGEPMADRLQAIMPELVWLEVQRCQQLMIDTRTFPSQPER